MPKSVAVENNNSIWIGANEMKKKTTSKLSIFYWFPFKCIHWKTGPIFNLYCCFWLWFCDGWCVLCAILHSSTVVLFSYNRSECTQVKWFAFEFCILFGIFLTWLSLSLVLAFHAKTFGLIDLAAVGLFFFFAFSRSFCKNSNPKPSTEEWNERSRRKKYELWIVRDFLRTQTECGQMLREPTNTDHVIFLFCINFVFLFFNFNFYIWRCLHQHMFVRNLEFENYVGLNSCLPNHLIFYVNYSVLQIITIMVAVLLALETFNLPHIWTM